MDWLSDWTQRTSYPYVLLEDDSGQHSLTSGGDETPEPVSLWRSFRKQVREPGTILSAMLPTITGGFAAMAIAWALVTAAPLSIVLGVIGVLLGVVTVRLFAVIDD